MVTGSHLTPDPTAVMGQRIAAFAIDMVLIAVIAAAVMLGAFFALAERAPAGTIECNESTTNISAPTSTTRPVPGAAGGAGGTDAPTVLPEVRDFCVQDGDDVLYVPAKDESLFVALAYLPGFFIGIADLVVLQGLTGASIGKFLVSLRVVRPDGSPIGVARALVRWFCLFIDAGCCIIIGLLTAFTTRGHRRVGDMVADTVVVARSDAGRPLAIPGVTTGVVPYGAYRGHGTDAGYQPPYGQPGSNDEPAGLSRGGDGPFWDDVRDTYIQYDRSTEAWVEWDEDARAWRPISR